MICNVSEFLAKNYKTNSNSHFVYVWMHVCARVLLFISICVCDLILFPFANIRLIFHSLNDRRKESKKETKSVN